MTLISELERKFRAQLSGLRGEFSYWTHPEKGPEGEELKSSVYLQHGDPRRLLISVSGTHGPEAYIGSIIQTEILRRLHDRPQNNEAPSILLIHNLNPFGSAWGRRGNHDNIDLNRNSWIGASPANPAFLDYKTWLSARSSLEFWLGLARSLTTFRVRTAQEIAGAIANGQSSSPNSVFYTGVQRSYELNELARILQNLRPEMVAVLDIHTGLGKFAHESLILETQIPAEWKTKMIACFGSNLIDLRSNHAYYAATGTLEQLVEQSYPKAKVCYVTQEFGTYSSLRVLQGLVLENSMWNSGRKNDSARLRLLSDLFFPSQKSWLVKVRNTGVKRFFNVLDMI